MFNIFELKWDEEICAWFGIDPANMAQVCDSDSEFGKTDFEGVLPKKVPIHGVLGDSHGSLFGQGCLKPGMTKSTYGTGSSIMMNIGEKPVLSTHGVVTSLAWSMGGKVNYVLEGNLNYTGAVITWLKDDLKLIESPGETGTLAREAIQDDELYLIPAFVGPWRPLLGQPGNGGHRGDDQNYRESGSGPGRLGVHRLPDHGYRKSHVRGCRGTPGRTARGRRPHEE